MSPLLPRFSDLKRLRLPALRPGDSFRLARMSYELVRAINTLNTLEDAVTVFGSARIQPDHPFYRLGMTVGGALARAGYAVVTGGGPGLMEAANRGAKEAGGRTFGMNIVLPHEQRANKYLDRVETFEYFFARKLVLTGRARAFVILPGGAGTLDELTEVMNLIQARKLDPAPIVLVGREFWQGLHDWMKNGLVAHGMVRQSELDLLRIADTPEEIVKAVAEAPRI